MSELPEPMSPGQLRASNADRERIAAVLNQAAADGRLDLDELDDRLAQAYAAKTYAELEPLTRDIATAGAVRLPTAEPPTDRAAIPTSRGAVAIMSGFQRRGRWGVPGTFSCLAFWGGGTVDLRDAYFLQGATKIRAFALMGGLEVLVPEDANVHVSGLGIMGGFDHGSSGAGSPGAPTVAVSGFALWGGVSVKRRPSPQKAKRRKLERERLEAEERRALDE